MKRVGIYMQDVVAKALLGLIEGYRLLVSPILGAHCRHLPTCSQYAKDAIIAHGPLHGSYYALKRILRCHPWVKPTLDPITPVKNVQESAQYVDPKNRRLGE